MHRGIDMPLSIPRDAVFIAEELMAAMIGGYIGFHVSDNDKGSHWILWIEHVHWNTHYDYYYDSNCYDPVAVCRKPGVPLERASIYLLRAWWLAISVYDESGDGRRGNTFTPTGGLNPNEFWGLIDELWPPPDYDYEAYARYCRYQAKRRAGVRYTRANRRSAKDAVLGGWRGGCRPLAG